MMGTTVGAQLLQLRHRRPHRLLDLRLHPVDEILGGQADAQPAHVAGERRGVVGHGDIQAGAVARVMPGDDAEQQRGVAAHPW